MTSFTVLRPGLLTTVQDLGRWGYQDRGVPVAGPMDGYSHRLANRLVGNDDDAAALDRIYANDFIGIGPSGTVRTKPQLLADFTSHDLKFQSITTDDVRIRVYGNTVVETGRSTMVGQDKGKVVPRDNRLTRVWVMRQGRWRLVANHYSTLIAQP